MTSEETERLSKPDLNGADGLAVRLGPFVESLWNATPVNKPSSSFDGL
jgi:hypothetical protein